MESPQCCLKNLPYGTSSGHQSDDPRESLMTLGNSLWQIFPDNTEDFPLFIPEFPHLKLWPRQTTKTTYTITVTPVVASLPRVGKSGFYGLCRTRFFLILSQICPVFCPIFIKFTKIYQNLPKFTKVYQIYRILPNSYQIVPIFYQIYYLRSFVVILSCCNLGTFSAKSVSPKSQGWKKIAFSHSAPSEMA